MPLAVIDGSPLPLRAGERFALHAANDMPISSRANASIVPARSCDMKKPSEKGRKAGSGRCAAGDAAPHVVLLKRFMKDAI